MTFACTLGPYAVNVDAAGPPQAAVARAEAEGVPGVHRVYVAAATGSWAFDVDTGVGRESRVQWLRTWGDR
jgi:hypothetical protein